MRYCENEPEPSSCICLSHCREAQQNHPASFIPKWKRSVTCTPTPTYCTCTCKCIYPNCSTLPNSKLYSFPHLQLEQQCDLCVLRLKSFSTLWSAEWPWRPTSELYFNLGIRVLRFQILNRLGIVISSDTHDGFVTHMCHSDREQCGMT